MGTASSPGVVPLPAGAGLAISPTLDGFASYVAASHGYASSGKARKVRRCDSSRTQKITMEDAKFLFKLANKVGAAEDEPFSFVCTTTGCGAVLQRLQEMKLGAERYAHVRVV